MAAAIVYVTGPGQADARRIGRTLVEERLAACANVLGGMTSVYRWQGKLQQDDEVVLILKTRQSLLNEVIDRVRALHPYECPCIVAWPIAAGNPAFLQWIDDETQRDDGVIV